MSKRTCALKMTLKGSLPYIGFAALLIGGWVGLVLLVAYVGKTYFDISPDITVPGLAIACLVILISYGAYDSYKQNLRECERASERATLMKTINERIEENSDTHGKNSD